MKPLTIKDRRWTNDGQEREEEKRQMKKKGQEGKTAMYIYKVTLVEAWKSHHKTRHIKGKANLW